MKNYIQTEDDKWYHFTRKDALVCCDCCLTHSLKFKIKNKKIYINLTRDDRATSAYRRGKEAKKVLKDIIREL